MAGNTFPIILAHGIARFDFLTDAFLKRLNLFLWDRSFAEDRLHYFKRIAPHLRAHGFEAYTTGVRFAADVGDRARDLRRESLRVLEKSGYEKVHIIGHSMGGLDARAMIVDAGMADKVASVTSIGAPHLGTSFADWALAHGGHEVVQAVSQVVDLTGFENITREAMAAFNERARNEEATNGVVYQTYAAWQPRQQVFGLFWGAWQIVNEREGANDGLVSAQSQRWAAELVSDAGAVKRVRQQAFPIAADHLNQVGWWDVGELLRVRWWRTGLLKEKARFETAVRNAYLRIARDVAQLDV